MLKKFIGLISVFAILTVVGLAAWVFSKPGTTTPISNLFIAKDEVIGVLQELETETVIGFSKIKKENLLWNLGRDGEFIQAMSAEGKGFEAKSVTIEEYDKIDVYFEKEGFEIDIYNISAGTISEAKGYKNEKEGIACLITSGVEGYEDAIKEDETWEPNVFDRKDVKVVCAKVNVSEIMQDSVEYQVRRLFAEKYNLKIAQVSISIDKEKENHIRGKISLSDAEGGIFFAAKVDSKWMLVFDGNGTISCEILEEYDFPKDMMEDCISGVNVISKNIGESFIIVLDSNPTTGYHWKEEFDSEKIELIKEEYIAPNSDLVGAGGQEEFTFKGVASGQTQIKFSYLRDWEESPIDEKIYIIQIKQVQ